MKRIAILFFTAFCSVVILAAVEDELESIQGNMPGCAIGIVSDEGLVFEKYKGYASLKYRVPISSRTVFNVGSISKHFTAAVFYRLEMKGLLSRTDTLDMFYPSGPEWFSKISLEHLITHRSGIPDFLNDQDFAGQLMGILASDLTIVSNLLVGNTSSV